MIGEDPKQIPKMSKHRRSGRSHPIQPECWLYSEAWWKIRKCKAFGWVPTPRQPQEKFLPPLDWLSSSPWTFISFCLILWLFLHFSLFVCLTIFTFRAMIIYCLSLNLYCFQPEMRPSSRAKKFVGLINETIHFSPNHLGLLTRPRGPAETV